jgi:hypothetical protein
VNVEVDDKRPTPLEEGPVPVDPGLAGGALALWEKVRSGRVAGVAVVVVYTDGGVEDSVLVSESLPPMADLAVAGALHVHMGRIQRRIEDG